MRVHPHAIIFRLNDPVSWQQLVTDLVQSLAWPSIVGLIIVLFRKPIAELLQKLETVEGHGLKARFDRKSKEVAEEVRLLPQQSDPPQLLEHEESIRRMAEVSPRSQILESWSYLEQAIYKAADKSDRESNLLRNELVPRDPTREARRLNEAGKLSRDDLRLAYDLQGLRNAVAHNHRLTPSLDDAVAFSLAAIAIERTLAAPG